ncbi:MAG: HAMP domain-containing histidine kinase [Blautia sp.]|nr:HAMP domain-containing histidine kinase [Lachnoclostridium sp.]MCM1211698.1 HAMP domain-containing histidine kinase [Blautia sp.]
MMTVSVVFIFLLYKLVQGRFANAIVGFLTRFIHLDYDTAMQVYHVVIRSRLEFIIMIAILVVFLIILRIYLRGFTRYFNEINQGINALLEEDTEDVALSPELSATEKKINSIKRTLIQRKLAMEIAEKKKNDLVVYLAHDLKTPLTSVIGYLTLLRDEGQISEELREKYLSISLEKAERLEELINEFFEITRFGLSEIALEYSTVNLTRLFEQLVYEFQPMFAEKDLKCNLTIAPDMRLKCDVDKMQRVFDNLLRNAVNYSFEHGTIEIRICEEEETMRILFSNHGNTIPAEKLERIFEQFYRLDTARGTQSGGAGLGLAIAKKIVELHGGSITARSETEIIEFEVMLPLS